MAHGPQLDPPLPPLLAAAVDLRGRHWPLRLAAGLRRHGGGARKREPGPAPGRRRRLPGRARDPRRQVALPARPSARLRLLATVSRAHHWRHGQQSAAGEGGRHRSRPPAQPPHRPQSYRHREQYGRGSAVRRRRPADPDRGGAGACRAGWDRPHRRLRPRRLHGPGDRARRPRLRRLAAAAARAGAAAPSSLSLRGGAGQRRTPPDRGAGGAAPPPTGGVRAGGLPALLDADGGRLCAPWAKRWECHWG